MKPENIILEGVVGSTAYGLATENSDVDIKGIYLESTEKILSLGYRQDKATKNHTKPDWEYHEVGKYINLVIGGNPTLTELLFLDEYNILKPVGKLLVDNRSLFLSTKAIRDSYSGYAKSQAMRLNNRTEQGLEGYDSSLKNRFAKHTRHCFRLLLQCKQLLQTGTLNVKVTKEEREWLFEMGQQTVETVVDTFISEDTKLKKIVSVLPDEPDREAINKLLYGIRMKNFE